MSHHSLLAGPPHQYPNGQYWYELWIPHWGGGSVVTQYASNSTDSDWLRETPTKRRGVRNSKNFAGPQLNRKWSNAEKPLLIETRSVHLLNLKKSMKNTVSAVFSFVRPFVLRRTRVPVLILTQFRSYMGRGRETKWDKRARAASYASLVTSVPF